ncbi:MAG: hypothetical protein ACUVXJ_12215 [Phycisphaerae bacterium]
MTAPKAEPLETPITYGLVTTFKRVCPIGAEGPILWHLQPTSRLDPDLVIGYYIVIC